MNITITEEQHIGLSEIYTPLVLTSDTESISISQRDGHFEVIPVSTSTQTARSIPVKPVFSNISKRRLESCDQQLQVVFETIIESIDCTILCGHRTQKEQEEACRTGHSQVKWPDSLHNQCPSQAIDVIPYPIDWKDRERMTLFAGFVLGVAKTMGITLRWGGDWNQNWNVQDNSFDDLVHFEIVE